VFSDDDETESLDRSDKERKEDAGIASERTHTLRDSAVNVAVPLSVPGTPNAPSSDGDGDEDATAYR